MLDAETKARIDSARDVLVGKAKVVDKEGIDQTAAFVKGAYLALAIAKARGAKRAYLKSKSP